MFARGVAKFILGLGKKIILSNNLALIADSIFNFKSGTFGVLAAWIGLISYSLQIYFDFSGYSDMAIGLGRMFGFEVNENFNYPYISKSVEFGAGGISSWAAFSGIMIYSSWAVADANHS